MMCTTHRTVAFGASLAVVAPIDAPLPIKVVLVGLGTHAGGWADYDTKGSTPSRELGPASQFVSLVVRGVAYMVQWATGDRPSGLSDVHRQWSHTVEACAIAGALTWYVASWWVLAAPWAVWFGVIAFVGSFSHVVAGDNFTPHGVPLCLTWNLLINRDPWRRRGGLRQVPVGVTTDHPSEHLVFMWVVRVAVVMVAVVAVDLPPSPYLLTVAAILGTGWHWVAVTGLMSKAFR
jgi:hypothetical protein